MKSDFFERNRTNQLTSISLIATSQALPKPTIKGAGNVPLLKPLSCPPPLICGSTRTRGRRRTYKAPIPLKKVLKKMFFFIHSNLSVQNKQN